MARVDPVVDVEEQPARGPARVAAIDCGTNSLRLLVADVTAGPGAAGPAGAPVLVDVERRMEVVRLGEGVDERGAFSDAALERTLAATQRCAETIAGLGASRVRFVATSASRDAANAHLLREGVRAVLGVDAEVVTGREEAELSFAGATAGLPELPGPSRASAPSGAPGERDGAADGGGAAHLVVDLGGGSTEMVLGVPGSSGSGALSAVSMDVGSVRLTERHALADPPSRAQVEAVRADARAAVEAAARELPLRETGVVVGVAGTVTTVAAHVLRLPAYDPARLHGAVLAIPDVLAACEELASMTKDRRAALPYLHPGRVDVIGAGALLWAEVLEAVSGASGVREVVVSEHDILDGIALRLGASAPRRSSAQA